MRHVVDERDRRKGNLFLRVDRWKVDHDSAGWNARLHSFEPVISRKEEAEWKSVNPRGETRVANDRFRPRPPFHSPHLPSSTNESMTKSLNSREIHG